MIHKKFKDIELSTLGMGNMRLPTLNNVPHGEIDYGRAQEIIDYAMSHGINYYDTAYTYPGSEAFLGTAMKKYPRDSYYLATKYWTDANPDYAAVFEEQLQKLQPYFNESWRFGRRGVPVHHLVCTGVVRRPVPGVYQRYFLRSQL